MWTSLLRINTPTRRHVHSILNKIRCKRRKKKPTSTTYFTCAIFPGISCNFLIHFFFRPGILQKIIGEKSVATPKSENCSGSSQRGFSQSLSRVNSHWRRLVNEHKKLERFSIDVVSLVLKCFLGNICGSRGSRGHGKDEKRVAVLRLSGWAFPCRLCVSEPYSWTLCRDYRQNSQEASGYEAVLASFRTPQPSRLSLFERLLHGTLILKGQFAPVKHLVSPSLAAQLTRMEQLMCTRLKVFSLTSLV